MITICGHRELEVILSEEKGKYSVILYTNSDWPPLPFVRHNAKEWTHLPVDDLDHYAYHEYKPIQAEDLMHALNFSNDKEDLICACHAGVSRSSATAYLVACKRWGAEAALDILDEDRHYPNRLIVYIGSKILHNQKIWDNYVDWQKEKKNLDPSSDGNWPPASVFDKIKF